MAVAAFQLGLVTIGKLIQKCKNILGRCGFGCVGFGRSRQQSSSQGETSNTCPRPGVEPQSDSGQRQKTDQIGLESLFAMFTPPGTNMEVDNHLLWKMVFQGAILHFHVSSRECSLWRCNTKGNFEGSEGSSPRGMPAMRRNLAIPTAKELVQSCDNDLFGTRSAFP